MRSTTFSAAAVFLSALPWVNGQTFSDCDPTKKTTCAPNPGLNGKFSTDFTKGKSSDWELADGTSMSYDGTLGAEFVIGKKTDAPTISSTKYINFGKVEVTMRASAGTGTVSSFILESDDLDEVDWEWLGSSNTAVQSNFYGKGNTTTYDRAIYHNMADPIADFHTYTIDWTQERLIWSIDNNPVRTVLYGDALALGGKNYPQTPMRVKMGNWIGCASAAAAADPKTKGTCDWAGGPVDLTKGPFTMHVKSVSVEDYGCGSTYTYTDQSGSWESIEPAITSCDGTHTSSSSTKSSSSTSTKSSAGSSTKASTTTSKASSTSTTTGGVLIETSAKANSSTTKTATSDDSTTATTLTRATGAATTPTNEGSSSSSTSTATGNPAQVSGNSAPKKYGTMDIGVIALGLGLGYLVM